MESKRTATTYFIPPGKFLLMENALGNPDLIQSSVSSDCRVTIVDSANFPLDELEQWPTFRLTSADIKLKLGNGAYYIYIVVPTPENTESTLAFISYNTALVDRDGYQVLESTDEEGNPKLEKGELLGKSGFKYYQCGTVSARGGNASATTTPSGQGRRIEMDLGVTPSPSTLPGGLNDLVKIFQLDKVDPNNINSWLLTILATIKSMVVKMLRVTGSIIFGEGENERVVTDVAVLADKDNKEKIADTILASTAWVYAQVERFDDRYLKKFEPDETEHRIKFFDGVECGEFVTGMIGGSGTRFDGDGYGEMNGLTLREFLEVPELRFNRIDVVSGELWNSVAFGLVESVDTENRICTLKLEGKERSGLKVNDICRGIFADFGDGEQWEGVDECGFLHLYGFWTSYFTPTEILDNDEGVFRFKYALKPGTSQHPTQSMKFAVYGNFDDTMPERQASAYSTRTYKRYLNKVNTWVIDPDRNIYAQYGDLEGLTIGGFTMTGYGSFQSNSYFTGVQIQFTPEQKEELKGEDSYTAVLSDYVGIVRMSSDGTVSSGEYVPFNVVTEGENVVTEGQNVITHDYILRTQIQAFKGSTELAYSEVMEEGCFIASINPTGCVATIENGVICVTEITSMEYSYIKIAVNCEGNASFELTYQIKLVKDGESAIYADIDNEMDAVACDKNGKVLFGLPVSCKAYMFAGTKALELDDITVSAPEGVEASAAVSADGVTGVVEVTGITEEAERVLPINVYLFATHNSQQHVRMLTFTVSKQMQGENGVIYKLVPTSTVLKADRDHSSEYMTVSCFVTKHDGLDVSKVDSLPDGYSMTYQVGSDNEEDYPYGKPVAVFPEEKEVVFRLYFGEELIDVETVPVLLDGNTAFKSTVFIRSNEEPRTPTGGSYSDPKPDSEPVWFDGIPRGEETLWASTRIFSIDGLYPQESSWSQPAPMTDTASFDVEFSDVQINPGNPTDNPENWSNEGGTDTWWMATRVIKNGVPGEWSISQIKGEKGEDGAPGEDGKDGIDGEDGADGKDGADAEDYIIETSVSSLGFTMTGGYSPSSFIVSEYHRKGATKTASNKYYMFIYGYKGGTSTYLTMSSSVQNYTFNTDPYDDERYDSFLFELRRSSSSSSELISSTTVSVSKEGKDGAMPRYCGLWRDDVTYEYNDEYRDIVVYKGQVYQVLAHGTSTSSLPTSTVYWEQASKFSFVAMDTALVDNANIAGFVFKDSVLQSQEGNLVLDGIGGEIKSKGESFEMTLKSDNGIGSPSLTWKSSGTTYAGMGVEFDGSSSYKVGTLSLRSANGDTVLLQPNYFHMTGPSYTIQAVTSNFTSGSTTYNTPYIILGSKYYQSNKCHFGMDSSGYIRIFGKWYDDSKKVNVGELWVDDDGYIKLRKS